MEKRKIVVLDAYSLCLDDNSQLIEALSAAGDVTTYDRTYPAQVIERSKDADFIFTNKTVIDANVINSLPRLKMIGVLATGYNVVDIEAARKRGIPVANVPAYSTESVAQMAFSHILNITQRVGHYSDDIRRGSWDSQPDFSYRDTPLVELAGKTIGIVGFGNTGQATTRLALAFGMNVQVFTSKEQSQLPQGVKKATLEQIFSESDIVSLHCPLTAQNAKMVNEQRLAMMKPTAIFINTARGGLVDEQALADALRNHKIWAAGLDVLAQEPPKSDNPLLKLDNCFITPHIAWATKEAITRLIAITGSNATSAAEGHTNNNVAK